MTCPMSSGNMKGYWLPDMKVLSVFGTRPEAIKMAPVVRRLQDHPAIVSRVCITAQHRDMLDEVLALFSISPDYDLDIMQQNQSLSYVTGQVLCGVEEILTKERPDWLLVQGDTTTVMAGALAAFYHDVPVGHVEAGLRTRNKRFPFPEEINRRFAGILADLHFAPTQVAKGNLLAEGVAESDIYVTGNTIVDALEEIHHRSPPPGDLVRDLRLTPEQQLILVTAHRRENFGEPLERICHALQRLASSFHPRIRFVYAVHPNPNVVQTAHRLLGNVDGITLTGPLDYATFVRLMNRAYLILTDSGGIQEEATVLGKPVLVLREFTERTEAIEAGNAMLVGTNQQRIIDATTQLIQDVDLYNRMALRGQVYGDGMAAERIVQALLKRSSRKVQESLPPCAAIGPRRPARKQPTSGTGGDNEQRGKEN